MTNENSILFPCIDNQNDGCPNMVAVLGSHCPDCAEFHANMAESKALLADDSWKSPAESIASVDAALSLLPGFEVVPFKGDIDNLPVIIHAEQSDLIIVEDAKPDLDSVCYTMNAQEVDAQNALREIVAILSNLQKSLNACDDAFEKMGVL